MMKRGFTALEILISAAILAFLSVIVISALSDFRDTRELSEAEEKIAGSFREARARTIASEGGDQFGVRLESSNAIIFVGPTFVPGDPQNEIIGVSPRVEIFDINFSGGSTVFERLTGEASPPGDVSARIRKDPSKSTTIFVNSSGLIYAQ